MKAKVRHLYEVIAGAILSLLGFSGCDNIEDIIYPKDEYGMPHATFKVIGNVKAEDSGNPIEGIQVKFRQILDEEYPFELEFKTDKDGKIDETFVEWPDVDHVQLTFKDIDGEENGGEFLPDTLRKKDLRIDLVEDKKSSWNKGTYTIAFDARLKKK